MRHQVHPTPHHSAVPVGPARDNHSAGDADHWLGTLPHRRGAACAPTAALVGHRSPLRVCAAIENHRSVWVKRAPLLVRNREDLVVRTLPVLIEVLPSGFDVKTAATAHKLIEQGPGPLRVVVAIAEQE